jgi:hypothetical protein
MRRRHKPESPSARGARFELLAAASCMQEGWVCFRNLSPVDCSDLLIKKQNTILRVQVRSTVDQWSEALKGNDVLIVVSVNNLAPRFYTNQPRAKWLRLFDAIEVLRKKRTRKR